MTRYAELQVTSHFSFLRGASSCEELFAQATTNGVEALGIVDRNSLAGIVRAHEGPLRTLTTLDRFGLVTWDGREPMLRVLQVDELRTAMGFPEGFKLDRGTRRDQIKMLGNGVCPPVMRSIVEDLC